jgi:hypothetical protein
MKKPVLRLKVVKESPEKEMSPTKENPLEESPERELTLKEQVMKLDDPRKKAFFRYHKWKNSILNEKNVKHADDWKLLLEHNQEFVACCTNVEKEEKPPLLKKSYSRIQSAKSVNSNVR